MIMTRRLVTLVLASLLLPSGAHAQSSPPAGQRVENVEADPIRCWWRTSTGAIRIGESFSVVLTCAVLQNEAVQVVPDESRLGSSVIQMAPFEVVGGAHPADLYSGERRFFQYQYSMRIINPDVIGKDIRVPDLLLHYRINSNISGNAALQGRDHTYLLPPQSVRVLAMVPADAPDIRDSSNESFGTPEALGFRANVLEIVAITAIVLGSLMTLVALIRLIVRTRKTKAVKDLGVGEPEVLRVVVRELAAVQRDSEAGWSPALVDRALAATRLAAASAINRPFGQRPDSTLDAGEGRLLVAGTRRLKNLKKTTRTTVSGAVTAVELTEVLNTRPETISPQRRHLLEDLQHALAMLTETQYARESSLDRSTLDDALTRALAAALRLKAEHGWPRAYLRRWTPRAAEAVGHM